MDRSDAGPDPSQPAGGTPGPNGARPVDGPRPTGTQPPYRLEAGAAAEFPETFRYRLKNRLLGPPLTTERLATERLGRPTALAVLSSDVISSSAYGPEQTLIPLIQAVGVAAFSLLVPVTIAIVVVLAFVTLSYLEVVKVYTKAGGAYVVARENFGLTVAQIAAVSLMIDYTLTVAVSVAAGVAALTSVAPELAGATVWIAVGLVVVIAFANLRGVREAGRVFAIPTYLFIANMALVIAVGAYKAVTGTMGHVYPTLHVAGSVPIGHAGSGWLYGASLFWILRSFASGGSALTGTEAISNGVSVFRRPESRNARITMVWMAVILGSLILGIAGLASVAHPVPFTSGTPTVIAQLARHIYGSSGFGTFLYWFLQGATMLILVLAANTSFTGFPYLASFAAEDSYLPRQLTKRGHRLVFSTGISVLTVISIALLLITRAQVDKLIPLYAIGVFTGFTMAGAGMVRFHLRHREPQWRRRAAINGTAAVLSFIVDIVIVITKFTEGAWAIVVILPLGVFFLLRLHHQYSLEDQILEAGASEAVIAPRILRRHVVVVLVDRLDLAVARALQYARTLSPDDLRAVHFDVDSAEARQLQEDWSRLGLSRLPLDIIEVPDRRIGRAAVELVADAVVDGDTECTVLLPRRTFASSWARFLHDRTADKIAAVVGQVPHVSATIIPYSVTGRWARQGRQYRAVLREATTAAAAAPGGLGALRDEPPGIGPLEGEGGAFEPGRPPRLERKEKDRERKEKDREKDKEPASAVDQALARRAKDTTPIGSVQWRQRVRVAGRVKSVRVMPRGGAANLECVLVDGTGGLLLVFQGRPRIPGIEPGARLVAEGMVGSWGRRLSMLNPDYELIAGPEADPARGV